MCGDYLDDLWSRWKRLAYAGRYGSQPLHGLLGRTPTEFEIQLFCAALEEWLEAEAPELPDFATGKL